MDGMRLFVAIVPPPAVLEELAGALVPIRETGETAGLRWTDPDSWHVTLAFLGEVAPGVLPELGTRLERAARRHPARQLAVRSGGAFPAPSRARVLWGGIDAGPDGLAALRALAASVAAGARRAGAPPPGEEPRFRPHLTLARLRDPADVREQVAGLAGLAGQAWLAADIQLIRSHLPAGDAPGTRPRYEPLERWPLRPRRD